jgi:iron complex transport system substrate-binding protein
MKNIFIKILSILLISIVVLVSFGGCSESTTTPSTTSTTTTFSTQLTQTQTTQAALPSPTQSNAPSTTTTSTSSTSSTTANATSTTSSTPAPTTTTTTTSSSSGGGGGGGGGGSSSYYISADILGTSYKIKTDSKGKVLKDFSAISDDGKLKLEIPANTIANDKDGKRLTNLSVVDKSNLFTAPEGKEIVVPVYTFGEDYSTFEPAITLTLKYDLISFPKVAEDLLYFATYNSGNTNWDESDAISPNTTQHTFTASIDHFSSFTLIGHTTRTIQDMYYDVSGTDSYHKTFEVPAVINRVLSGGPVETQLIYMLAPEKLAAVNGSIAGVGIWTATTSFWNSSWDGTAPYIPDQYLDEAAGGPVPDIGNGSSNSLNFEEINKAAPDIVLEGKTKNLSNYRSQINAPVIGVNSGNSLCWDFKNEIRFVGDLLGVPDKADDLITYYEEAMDYVNTAVDDIRPDSISDNDTASQIRVLYAQGTDGYSTDAKGSWHTNLLWFCGGANVADVDVSNTSQAVAISGEQILAWEDEEPIDMIIIGRSSQANTHDTIMNDEIYQTLVCVQLGKVYVRPDNPTSWFDGPPGYGQIIGMYWMVDLLYPDKTHDLNLSDKIKEFYSKFLHYDLTSAQVNQLLKQPNQ